MTVSAFVGTLVLFLSNETGTASSSLIFGRDSANWTLHEQLSADLEKARHSKRQEEYDSALTTVQGVLTKAPEFPEALYLKAQVLWEGFGNSGDAKRCLKKVLWLVPYDETLHRWASSYYYEVVEMEKKAAYLRLAQIKI